MIFQDLHDFPQLSNDFPTFFSMLFPTPDFFEPNPPFHAMG
jgi:hypothetical protein